jgi:hypothetical protein
MEVELIDKHIDRSLASCDSVAEAESSALRETSEAWMFESRALRKWNLHYEHQ